MKISGSRPVFKVDMDKVAKAIAQSNTEREERERRATESVTLTVGKHKGCGGDIVYHSSFVLAVSMSEVRFGGKNPTREEATCSCKKCGVAFDPRFEPYRSKIEKHRNGQ